MTSTNTSPDPFLSEIVSREPIPAGKLVYFRTRFSNALHQLVLGRFMDLEASGNLSRAELARRIGRKPEQLTRWLGSPGNWTLETVSDLLLGMAAEPAISLVDFRVAAKRERREQALNLPSAPLQSRAANDEEGAWALTSGKSGASGVKDYPGQSIPNLSAKESQAFAGQGL